MVKCSIFTDVLTLVPPALVYTRVLLLSARRYYTDVGRRQKKLTRGAFAPLVSWCRISPYRQRRYGDILSQKTEIKMKKSRK